jgi:hypothetical protein
VAAVFDEHRRPHGVGLPLFYKVRQNASEAARLLQLPLNISSRPKDRQISEMHFLMLLLYVSLTILGLRVNADGCYYSANNSVWDSPSWVSPCTQVTANAPIVNCCAVNSNNICLSSHLCYNPNVPETFYLSPCTDSEYQSSICPRYCREPRLLQIPLFPDSYPTTN